MDIKRGDVFICGRHRLMCGDSLSLIDVQKLLDGQTADMIFTDPPYSVNYDPKIRKNGSNLGKIMNDIDFPLQELLKMIDTGIVKGAVYMCCATGQIGEIFNWAFKRFKRRPQILIWAKNGQIPLNKDYAGAYEPVAYFYYPEKKFRGERNQNDVWFIKRANTMKYVHPTQKPVRLVQKAILNSSDKNEIVLDLFGGSGSTIVACENTERRAYLMELDPKYVEVIIKRWEALTGGKAKKI